MTEPCAALEDQLPVIWDRAVNATVYSGDRTYIDFTSGIFVANVGHSHPGVIAALRAQLDHQLLHTYTFPSASRMRLANKCARERMTVLYDQSAAFQALVAGTSNKTRAAELLGISLKTLHNKLKEYGAGPPE